MESSSEMMAKPQYNIPVEILPISNKSELSIGTETVNELISKHLNRAYKKFGHKNTLKYKISEIRQDLEECFPFQSDRQTHELLVKIVKGMKLDSCLFYVDSQPEFLNHRFVSITSKEMKARLARKAAITTSISSRSRMWHQDESCSDDLSVSDSDSTSGNTSNEDSRAGSCEAITSLTLMSSPLRCSPLPGFGTSSTVESRDSELSLLFSVCESVKLPPLHFSQKRTPIGKKKCKKNPKKRPTTVAESVSAGDDGDIPVDDEEAEEVADAAVDIKPDNVVSSGDNRNNSSPEISATCSSGCKPEIVDERFSTPTQVTVAVPLAPETIIYLSTVTDPSWTVVKRNDLLKRLNKGNKISSAPVRKMKARSVSALDTGPHPVVSHATATVPQTPAMSSRTNLQPPLQPTAADLTAVVQAATEVNTDRTPLMPRTINNSTAAPVLSLQHCHFVPDSIRDQYVAEIDYDTAVRVVADTFIAQHLSSETRHQKLSREDLRQSMDSHPSEVQLSLESHGLQRSLLVEDVWECLKGDERLQSASSVMRMADRRDEKAETGVVDKKLESLPRLLRVGASAKDDKPTHTPVAETHKKAGLSPPVPTHLHIHKRPEVTSDRIALPTPPPTAAFIEGIHWLAEQFVRSAVTSIASSGHPYHVSNVYAATGKREFFENMPIVLKQSNQKTVVHNVVEAMKQDVRLRMKGSVFWLGERSRSGLRDLKRNF